MFFTNVFSWVKLWLIFLCCFLISFETIFANLIITEVYYDGTDERIEVSNLGDTTFSGWLSIAGAKASIISIPTISIPVGGSRIFGDTMSMIVDQSVVGASWLGMSMSDTSALNLTLSSSGTILDTFAVDTALVLQYDNTKNSFARAWYNGVLNIFPTCSWSVYNVNSAVIANPWVIWSVCIISSTWQNLTGWTSSGENLSWSSLTGTNLSWSFSTWVWMTGDMWWSGFTGTDFTGWSFTWSSLTGILVSWQVSTWILYINEIHAKTSWCLDEYIVIQATAFYSGMIDVYGLGTSSAIVSFPINISTGEQLIIADKTGFASFSGVIIVPSITLTDAWEQLQILISWQLVDNVNYAWSSDGDSFFFTSINQDVRQFTTIKPPSFLLPCDTTSYSSGIFMPFTGWFGFCDIHLTNSTDLGSGVYNVNFSVSGSFVQFCNTDSQRIVNGVLIQSNTCSLTLNTQPGIQQINFIQYSGGVSLCQDEMILNSSFNSTQSTSSVDICLLTWSNTSYTNNFDCFVRLQHSTPVMFGNSINLVAQANWSDLSNSSSYSCVRSGTTFLTGCNPWYFEYNTPGVYPIDLTITRSDGAICKTHLDFNYPWDTPVVTGTLSGMSCGIRFQNTGPYDIGDSINLISQVDSVDILSTSSYSCVRSGTTFLTGCNPWYFEYQYSGVHHVDLLLTRLADGATCSTSTSIAVWVTGSNSWSTFSTFSSGTNSWAVLSTPASRFCGIRFQNSWAYYPGSSINIVWQANSTDLTNSSSTYSCIRTSSGWVNLTGCNPGYFTIHSPGTYPFSLQIKKSDGSVCQTQTQLTIQNSLVSSSAGSSSSSSSSTSSSSGQPTPLSCAIRFQNTWPYDSGDPINVIAQHHQTDIQNSNTSYTCQWTLGNGQTLTQCNPSYFSYTWNGNYHLILRVIDRYGQSCQSDEYLVISSQEFDTLDLQWSEDIDQWSWFSWYLTSWWNVWWSTIDSFIDLKCVMTNPIWSDTKQEHIILTLLTWGIIDLSEYRLRVWSRNKLLSWYLTYGQDLDILSTRWLSNSTWWCISIVKDKQIIDTLCYPKLWEWELYCDNVVRSFSGAVVKKITKKTTTTIKKDQIAKLKASCQKKIDRVQISKDKMKARYEKRILSCKNQTAKVRKNYATYRHNTKQRMDLLKWELYLYKNYSTLVNTELNKNRDAVIDYSDPLKHYMKLLAQGKQMIKQKRHEVDIWPCQTLPYYKLKEITQAQHRLAQDYVVRWMYQIVPHPYQVVLDHIIWQTGVISDKQPCISSPFSDQVWYSRFLSVWSGDGWSNSIYNFIASKSIKTVKNPSIPQNLIFQRSEFPMSQDIKESVDTQVTDIDPIQYLIQPMESDFDLLLSALETQIIETQEIQEVTNSQWSPWSS